MNKYDNSEMAMNELRVTNQIEIIQDDELEEYQRILDISISKDELIKNLKDKEFSEFVTGIIIGMQLALEGKVKNRANMKEKMKRFFKVK